MRIISQDGNWDIPYEHVAIQRFGNDIYFLNANLVGVEGVTSDMKIATYSTVKKAEDSMKSLRLTYEYYLSCTNQRPYTYFQFQEDSEV